MPRDLPLGNGDMLITFDQKYQLRDIFFPYVGLENHTLGGPCRFGLWVDGRFSWISDEGWVRDMRYRESSLVTKVTLTHPEIPVTLICHDTVDFDRNLYLKEVHVQSSDGRPHSVRLFQHFDAHLYGNDFADSAYYDPRLGALVHYKGRRYVALAGYIEGQAPGLSAFTIGKRETNGGSWLDAQDGHLTQVLAAHGSLDSVGQLNVEVPAQGEVIATFTLTLAKSYEDISAVAQVVAERSPRSFVSRSFDYWRLWANKDRTLAQELPEDIERLYRLSTLIVRTQIDNRGAILAGNDSDVLRFNRDTYSYLWPRDGALVAAALDQAGYGEITRRFFTQCAELITSDGYLLHKYGPDGAPGSSWHPWSTDARTLELPIQEDETALPLWALWRHYQQDGDIEFIRPLYSKLIRKAAEFMTSFRDASTSLPAPSYDLWEERRGIHAFTSAAVWAGLTAAASFADAFGQHELSTRFGMAATEIKAAVLAHMYDSETGRFVRTVQVAEDGTVTRDMTVDVSLLGLALFGMVPATDVRMQATVKSIEEKLWVRTAIGGLARYEQDSYFQQAFSDSLAPGNPWFVGTLWLAEYYMLPSDQPFMPEKVLDILHWTARHALPSGVLAEQIHPYTGASLSVSPLTWSHAAYIAAVQSYVRLRASLRKSHPGA